MRIVIHNHRRRRAADAVPDWPGASAVYTKLYKILENMRAAGGATAAKVTRTGKVRSPGSASGEMEQIVAALNKGDEETLKAMLWQYRDYLYR